MTPRIHVAASIHPTEDPAVVLAAMTRFLVPAAEPVLEPTRITFEAQDLSILRRRIWELRIIDAARGPLLRGVQPDGRSLVLRLSKQAAVAGHVSFPTRPHALGDLEVRIEDAGPIEPLVWWLCPETRDGEIVGAPGVAP